MTNFRKLFDPENVKDIYRKIMKEGYMSNGAGDMWEPIYRPDDLASAMQSILNEALDKARVVYAEADTQPWHNVSFQGITHKALLIQVEPIKECEHKPYLDYDAINEHSFYICSVCEKELIPTGFKIKE